MMSSQYDSGYLGGSNSEVSAVIAEPSLASTSSSHNRSSSVNNNNNNNTKNNAFVRLLGMPAQEMQQHHHQQQQPDQHQLGQSLQQSRNCGDAADNTNIISITRRFNNLDSAVIAGSRNNNNNNIISNSRKRITFSDLSPTAESSNTFYATAMGSTLADLVGGSGGGSSDSGNGKRVDGGELEISPRNGVKKDVKLNSTAEPEELFG